MEITYYADILFISSSTIISVRSSTVSGRPSIIFILSTVVNALSASMWTSLNCFPVAGIPATGSTDYFPLSSFLSLSAVLAAVFVSFAGDTALLLEGFAGL